MAEASSPKRRRIAPTTTQPAISCCFSIIDRLEKKIDTIYNKISDLEVQSTVIQGQLESILDGLADDKTVQVREQEDRPLFSIFPIQTTEDLAKLDENINEKNKDSYGAIIRKFFQSGGVTKNLKMVLSNDVVMAYNIDGVHGKLALKNLQNFYAILLDSIIVDSSSGSAEDQLRKAIQLQKKRYFKYPAQLLLEERAKLPCKRYFSGYCKFDLFCQYGHYNEKQLMQLQKVVNQLKKSKHKKSETRKQQIPWQSKPATCRLPPSMQPIDFSKIKQVHFDSSWG